MSTRKSARPNEQGCLVTESQHREKRNGVLPRTVAVITVVELTIGVIALLSILALVFAQAAQRYSPFEGFAWTCLLIHI